MYKKIEKRLKDRPLTTGIIIVIFTYLVPEITNLINSLIKGIPFKSVINYRISLQINLIIMILIIIVYSGLLIFFLLRRKKLSTNVLEDDNKSKITLHDWVKISSIKNNEILLNSNFLKSKEGTFQIWVYIENGEYSKKRYEYFASHCFGDSTKKKLINSRLSNTERLIYNNAWAISRVMPKNIYQFFYNNNEDQVNLAKEIVLKEDWHLFTVVWSEKHKRVGFFIDDDLVGEGSFEYWPREVDAKVIIGTWPNRNKLHYYESFISKPRITAKVLTKKQIEEIYSSKKF